MANQKSTQVAPDGVIEKLLAEIANTANVAELRLISSAPAGCLDATELELDTLRQVVKQMGWMADFALKRLGSPHCINGGDAAAWLLWPATTELLNAEVQS